jgi:hypothetical protein
MTKIKVKVMARKPTARKVAMSAHPGHTLHASGGLTIECLSPKPHTEPAAAPKAAAAVAEEATKTGQPD